MSKNYITGDRLTSKIATDLYRENWERIFNNDAGCRKCGGWGNYDLWDNDGVNCENVTCLDCHGTGRAQ